MMEWSAQEREEEDAQGVERVRLKETRSDGVEVVFSRVGYRLPAQRGLWSQVQGWFRAAAGAVGRKTKWRDEATSSGGEESGSSSGATTDSLEDVEAGTGVRVRRTRDKGFEAEGKEVLRGLSGSVKPGEFLAVLGPSGSGKTTFLNLLSGRSEFGLSAGAIRFNGRPRAPRMRRKIAYVMQDDVFFSKLTVFQTLHFTSRVRLPDSMSGKEKLTRVEETMERLRLTKARDTQIGDQSFNKGISGGERKRVNIGNELLTDPALVLLDEPTSGLDSSTALTVVGLLRELADEGRSVIATIHQPSSTMFRMFDKIMLLSEGRVVYFGPAKLATSYFASIGFKLPLGYNPADYFMDLLIDSGDGAIQERLVESWEERKHEYLPLDVIDGALGGQGEDDEQKGVLQGMKRAVKKRAADLVGRGGRHSKNPKYPTSWFSQLRALASRGVRQKGGQLIELYQLCLTAATGLLAGIFWFQLEQTEETLEERIGMMFFTTVYLAFSQMFDAMFAFPPEKEVLNKDRSGGSYRLSAYFAARTLIDIPFDTVYPSVYVIISYWLAGLNPSIDRFIVHLLVVYLLSFVSSSIGVFVSAAVMNVKKGQTLATLVVLASLLVGGFYVKNDNLPSWIAWVAPLSFIKYPFEALVRNEIRGRTYVCTTPATVYRAAGCPVDAAGVLEGGGLSQSFSVLGNSLVMLAWVAAFRLLAYLSLKYLHRTHKQRARKS